MKRRWRFVAAVGVLTLAGTAEGYNEGIHQQLTFMAARQFNRCVEGTELPMLKPLQVRYIVKANLREQARIGRWHYYDQKQTERRALWFIETSLHERFNDKLSELDEAEEPTKKYAALGSLLSFIQGVTSPVQVVPIFHPRWWRLAASDRFNHFAVDADAVLKLLGTSCSPLFAMEEKDFLDVLINSANVTLDAVRGAIPGMNATWRVFWQEDPDFGDFGQYGDVGNSFGREVEFKCGEEACQLLQGDPIYREFADQRHAQAVLSTMKAMLIMQRRRLAAGSGSS